MFNTTKPYLIIIASLIMIASFQNCATNVTYLVKKIHKNEKVIASTSHNNCVFPDLESGDQRILVNGEGLNLKEENIAGDAKRILIYGDANFEKNSVTISTTLNVPVFFCGVTVKSVSTENCAFVKVVNPENTTVKKIILAGSESSCRRDVLMSSL